MKASEIIESFGLTKYEGNLNREITDFNSVSSARVGSLVFCKDGKESALSGLKGCTVILSKVNIPLPHDNTYIMVDNPRLTFAKVIKKFFKRKCKEQIFNGSISLRNPNVHPTAVIETLLDSSIIVGPYSCIGKGCEINRGTEIGSYVCIYSGKVRIGKNVKIQSHVAIGSVGFGFERNEDGKWEGFPQVGGVLIGDDVEIAVGTNVHRGTLDDTIIGEGTKVSIGCNIGHNSEIGKHTFIAGSTNLGGKTQIGDYCFIGMGVVTKPGVRIGNNVIIGMGSIVTKNIKDSYIAYGFPAEEIRENQAKYGR